MAPFEVDAVIANPSVPKRVQRVRLSIESGSTLSWLSGAVLEALGVASVCSANFVRRDGSRTHAETGMVLLTLRGRTAAVPFAFGPQDQTGILGATALDTLGLSVDWAARKLIPCNLRFLSASNHSPAVRAAASGIFTKGR
jgi:hypothetical protein